MDCIHPSSCPFENVTPWHDPPTLQCTYKVGTIAPLLQANRSSQNANPRWIWRGWDAFGVPTSRGSGAHVGSTSGEFEVKIGSLLRGTNHHSAIHEFLEVQERTKIICHSGWIPGWIWICSSYVLQSLALGAPTCRVGFTSPDSIGQWPPPIK